MAEVTDFRNNALPYPVYGVPWTIVFPLLDADGDPVTGATCDSEVSINGDTGADCTNEGTEITFTTATNKGQYYLTLTAAEMTGDIITVSIYSATSKATVVVLYPRKLVPLASGTSQGGAAGYITLAANTVLLNDQYNGCLCVATIDTLIEARVLQVCTASNQQCTVTPGWNVSPDADDTYIIYLPEGRQVPTVNVRAISWDETAADNMESDYDGTGYAGGTIVKTGDVTKWLGQAAHAATVNGVPVVQLHDSAGAGGINAPANFEDMSITDTTGLVAMAATQKVDVETIKTQVVTCAAGVTVLASVGAPAAPGSSGGLPTTNGTKLNQTVDLTAGQSIACSDKTGFSLASTGADLILKSSTFIQAIVAAVNEFATYGLTALNTLLVTTGIKAVSIPAATLVASQHVIVDSGTVTTLTNAPTDMALNSTVAKEATLSTVAGYLDTEIAAILADTNELQLNQGNWLTATGFSTHNAADVKTAMEAVGGNLALILEDTGTTIPGTITTVNTTVTLVEDILRNKMEITDANGNLVLYADNGSDVLYTVATAITDNSTTTTRKRIA
jgi:hypothetical protein